MKIVQIGLFLSLLFLTQSIFFAKAPVEKQSLVVEAQESQKNSEDDICEPHLSIENQRSKKISKEARELLKKIIKDIESKKLKNNQTFFDWPVLVCKCWVSSLFGPRKSGHHNGVDLAASKDTPVYAVADGIVEIAELNSDAKGYGNMILINHEHLYFYDQYGDKQSYKSRYGHLNKLFVTEGQRVKQGQKIGTVGATGHVVAKHAKSDPSHLHFEIYRGSKRINPLIVLFASDYVWVKQNLEE